MIKAMYDHLFGFILSAINQASEYAPGSELSTCIIDIAGFGKISYIYLEQTIMIQ